MRTPALKVICTECGKVWSATSPDPLCPRCFAALPELFSEYVADEVGRLKPGDKRFENALDDAQAAREEEGE